jgi:signal transduction histidine kinase
VLTESGLGPALESLAERCPLPVTLELEVDGRLDDVVEATAYFAASEALTNSLKYADVRHVEMSASCVGDILELRVRDNGCGGAVLGAGTGLVGLADRVAALGGTLDLDSPPAHGTSVLVRIPLSPASRPPDQLAEAARR